MSAPLSSTVAQKMMCTSYPVYSPPPPPPPSPGGECLLSSHSAVVYSTVFNPSPSQDPPSHPAHPLQLHHHVRVSHVCTLFRLIPPTSPMVCTLHKRPLPGAAPLLLLNPSTTPPLLAHTFYPGPSVLLWEPSRSSLPVRLRSFNTKSKHSKKKVAFLSSLFVRFCVVGLHPCCRPCLSSFPILSLSLSRSLSSSPSPCLLLSSLPAVSLGVKGAWSACVCVCVSVFSSAKSHLTEQATWHSRGGAGPPLLPQSCHKQCIK